MALGDDPQWRGPRWEVTSSLVSGCATAQLFELLGFEQVRARVWWPLCPSSLRQAAWLCAHRAKWT